MADVINLNRFRKKKAKEEKEKRAEKNRRLHGRNKSERALEDAQKKLIEDKLDGAFLVRESVRMEDIPQGDTPEDYVRLEAATESAPTLAEFSEKLQRARKEAAKSSPSEEEDSQG